MDLRWCFFSGKTWVRQLLMTDFGAAKLFSHKGVAQEDYKRLFALGRHVTAGAGER